MARVCGLVVSESRIRQLLVDIAVKYLKEKLNCLSSRLGEPSFHLGMVLRIPVILPDLKLD